MIDFSLGINDIKNKKNKVSTKTALSKQAVVENAINNRQPQNPNTPVQPPIPQTVDGFGRTV